MLVFFGVWIWDLCAAFPQMFRPWMVEETDRWAALPWLEQTWCGVSTLFFATLKVRVRETRQGRQWNTKLFILKRRGRKERGIQQRTSANLFWFHWSENQDTRQDKIYSSPCWKYVGRKEKKHDLKEWCCDPYFFWLSSAWLCRSKWCVEYDCSYFAYIAHSSLIESPGSAR